MKTIVLLAMLVSSFSGFAESKLSCWNIFDKKGSAPIFTANIESDNVLTHIKFDFKNEYFAGYFYKNSKSKSYLVNPTLEQRAEVIVSNRSPYKGNNDYKFELGRAVYNSEYHSSDDAYNARLILPKDLSNESLKKTILSPGTRSNAVVDLDPSKGIHQYGQNYLRMFCVSK